ncbi:1218_t:CDS:2, partial [Dentiscutata heterogama]
NGCHKGKCNWKGHIVVLRDKLINLCNIECHGNHDPEHIRKKQYRIAKVIRKEITNRSTNVTPSTLATEFINDAKISSITTNTYETEGVIISKQYGIKNSQDPKEQAVLLGIASSIMPMLLTKYSDLLVVDSTGHHNCLNFLNTAFMIRSDEPRGRIIATFISNKETILVVDLMFESLIQYTAKNNIKLNPKWLTIDKWDPYLVVAKKHFPNTQEEFDQRKSTILDAEKLQAAIGTLKLNTAKAITSYF